MTGAWSPIYNATQSVESFFLIALTVLLTFQNLISLILLSAAISIKVRKTMAESLFEEKSGEIVPLRKLLVAFHVIL